MANLGRLLKAAVAAFLHIAEITCSPVQSKTVAQVSDAHYYVFASNKGYSDDDGGHAGDRNGG